MAARAGDHVRSELRARCACTVPQLTEDVSTEIVTGIVTNFARCARVTNMALRITAKLGSIPVLQQGNLQQNNLSKLVSSGRGHAPKPESEARQPRPNSASQSGMCPACGSYTKVIVR